MTVEDCMNAVSAVLKASIERGEPDIAGSRVAEVGHVDRVALLMADGSIFVLYVEPGKIVVAP